MVDALGNLVNQVSSHPVSPFFRGVAIFHLERKPKGSNGPLEDWQILRMVYGGNGFRIFKADEAVSLDGSFRLPLRQGKTLVVAAERHFGIRVQALNGKESVISSHSFGDQQKTEVVMLNGPQNDIASLRFEPSEPAPPAAIFSEAILPDYMSVQAFNQ